MRILITNNTLANRAGSELYVLDLARSLQDRGHTPIAFSTLLGPVAEELRKATIPVVDDLIHLPARPDIIHGHHHLDTMTALLSLPGVPAVYFCHGWIPWQEMPPVFPRILRYVAVDHVCLDRILFEQRIPEDKVRVMLNFVDLRRFQPRPPLPARPRRALVFSNQAHEGNYLQSIRKACARFGLKVQVAGIASQTATNEPERILPEYDLVFAKARAALEAMAVGNAVILCDAVGCGPLVSTQNLAHLRPLNFGVRTLRQPITVENLAEQISRYQANDAAQVSQAIRQQAGLEEMTGEIIGLYEEVLAEHRQQPAADLAQELSAAAAYFKSLVPILKRVV